MNTNADILKRIEEEINSLNQERATLNDRVSEINQKLSGLISLKAYGDNGGDLTALVGIVNSDSKQKALLDDENYPINGTITEKVIYAINNLPRPVTKFDVIAFITQRDVEINTKTAEESIPRLVREGVLQVVGSMGKKKLYDTIAKT
jgi:hypothetical protein